VDLVEICNVYVGKMMIKAAKRIFNSGKIRRSYSDLNFGVTFLEHSVVIARLTSILADLGIQKTKCGARYLLTDFIGSVIMSRVYAEFGQSLSMRVALNIAHFRIDTLLIVKWQERYRYFMWHICYKALQ